MSSNWRPDEEEDKRYTDNGNIQREVTALLELSFPTEETVDLELIVPLKDLSLSQELICSLIYPCCPQAHFPLAAIPSSPVTGKQMNAVPSAEVREEQQGAEGAQKHGWSGERGCVIFHP